MAINETKGYLSLRGEVYNLGKAAYENQGGTIRQQKLTVKTSENHRVGITLGKWKNTNLNIKMKCEGMDKAIQVNEQESIDEVKASFVEGDSVFVNCRSEINTKDGSIDFLLNNIYIADKKVDFAAADFKETSELSMQAIIAGKVENGVQPVIFANYRGETIRVNLNVKDEDIVTYLSENAEVGDLVKLFIYVVIEPIYEEKKEDTSKNKEQARTTLKNRTIGGDNSGGKGKIKGMNQIFEITDIDIAKTEKAKYTAEELGLTTKTVSDNDMPF